MDFVWSSLVWSLNLNFNQIQTRINKTNLNKGRPNFEHPNQPAQPTNSTRPAHLSLTAVQVGPISPSSFSHRRLGPACQPRGLFPFLFPADAGVQGGASSAPAHGRRPFSLAVVDARHVAQTHHQPSALTPKP
jgi:hypothetical protein